MKVIAYLKTFTAFGMKMVANKNVLYSANLVVVVLDFFKGMGGLNYRIFFVLNMYVKVMGYLQLSFVFYKYNGDGLMNDVRAMTQMLGAGEV